MQHERLTNLRNTLLRLHKVLLDSESKSYDRDMVRITSRGQLLQLVLNDPWFAWLRELSELIVFIDESLAAEEPVSENEADRVVSQARALLVPAEAGTGFGKRYFEALQRDPDVVLAHAEAVRRIAALV